MKLPRTILLAALAAAVAAPALAVAAPTTAPAPIVVARYTFDAGIVGGRIAENSGRGYALRVRAVNAGVLRFGPRNAGRYIGFPARCAATAQATCRRLILEGGDDADLDPGTGPFRYGASVNATRVQVGTQANIMQKGVATAESQWKLQIGGARTRAQCVLVGRGSTRAYMAKSDISVADGRWHQVTCVRTATVLAVYVDGKLRGSIRVPSTLSVSNAMPLRIGGRNLSGLSDLYGGNLDDVFVARG